MNHQNNNQPSSRSIATIAELISSNGPTELLRLRTNILERGRIILLNGNKISDSDTLLLASALENNTHLKQLDLRNTNITEEGEKILLKAMFDPTSMDSIIGSNHTCQIFTYDINNPTAIDQRPPLEREVFMINGWEVNIQQKIREKLVLALCGVDGGLFDLSSLNDLPLGVMPRVLELIQKHTTMRRSSKPPIQLEKDALTRLFHTLRSWELPLLFENLNRPSTNNGTTKRKRRKTRH